jgi:hypothetical protein
MYTNPSLTIPITGYIYITPASGEIFNLNTSTGMVGSDTGSSCNNGTAGSYILGNSTGSICTGSTITMYTNGAFSVGGILYVDSALTTPITGFSYVVDNSTGNIYNLNSSTGVIGSSTGLLCSGIFGIGTSSAGSIINVGGIVISGLTPPFPVPPSSNANGTHGAYSGIISVQYSGIAGAAHLNLVRNGGTVQCRGVSGSGTFNFLPFSFLASDHIQIILGTGIC